MNERKYSQIRNVGFDGSETNLKEKYVMMDLPNGNDSIFKCRRMTVQSSFHMSVIVPQMVATMTVGK